MLSHVVMNTELRHPGQPPAITSGGVGSTGSQPQQAHDVSSVVLALRTLGTFNFDGTVVMLFCYSIIFHQMLLLHKRANKIQNRNFFLIH